jgi:uncharacterized OB-fold protein
MGDGILLQECCRTLLFPDRLRCPACGSTEFQRVRITAATVHEVTARPGAQHAIATISSKGATMIARVPATAQPGDDIRLTSDPHDTDGAFVPSAVRDGHS